MAPTNSDSANSGFKVTILEARDRVGGRVHQQRLANGHLVDLGPNWIHGTQDNPLLEVANGTKTSVGGLDGHTWAFTSAGHLLPRDEGDRYSTMVWDLVQQAFDHSKDVGAEIDKNKSLLDFFHQRIPHLIPETDVDYKRRRDITTNMTEMWGAFIGSPVSRQSLKYFWLEECLEGENLFCGGTYQKILSHVAAPALERADIRFHCQVEQIRYPPDSSGKVDIHLVGGETLSCDEAVVTTPLGWLKRNPSAFLPALPPRLTQAINSISYGCLEKVYISFPHAFWLQPLHGQQVSGFIEWLVPKYAADSNPRQWHQEAVELASLEGSNAHPTLLFYTFGEQSAHVTSTLSRLMSQEAKTAFLNRFFHPYYSRLPNYRADSSDCQPLEFVATDWSNDEFAGHGSYCNFQIGLEHGDEDIETMRKGLPDQRLWFAGEHTAPFLALGTATGAYWSGEMVGKRIVEANSRARHSGEM
ncbi:hypothetical protein E4U42_000970 [Claviceps africana]|uniref:Amine oxidase domain-containing protein n=1 Tax=Claviceps africana TaxID=83212 RepID=A0A8K0J9T1_9HYPO|nr:hypothetical protein E4U42_000970 [Claviceps africana]